MTTLVYTNKLTWFQDAGEPLKSGYIYVGDPNTDPQNFPKTVTFTDSDGNAFTAPQPLRTNNDGRIQWNGKAITATVDGDYSLLILKSDNATQINDGYISSVTDFNAGGGGGGDITNYREYGLTLADTKQISKNPGQTVGSVGKAAVEDGEGANWIVLSNTGSPADDVDLIDFDNGTQGRRLRNFLQPQDNLDNLADNDQARTNLGIKYTQQVFTSSGTWNRPVGCRFVDVLCIGGGGSSGSASSPSGLYALGAGGGVWVFRFIRWWISRRRRKQYIARNCRKHAWREWRKLIGRRRPV